MRDIQAIAMPSTNPPREGLAAPSPPCLDCPWDSLSAFERISIRKVTRSTGFPPAISSVSIDSTIAHRLA